MGDADVKLVIAAVNQASATISQVQQQLGSLRNSYGQVGQASATATETARRLTQVLSGQSQAASTATRAQAQLSQAVNSAATQMASQAGVAGTLAASLGGISLAIAAVAGAAVGLGIAMMGASKFIGEYQEKMDIMSEQTGISVRTLGGLELGAANVGRSLESVSSALFIFNRNLAEGQQGSADVLRVFDRLGVSIRGTSGEFLGTEDVLRAVGAALAALPAGAERSAAAMKLFGRGAREVLPIITQDMAALSSEAVRLGIVLSEEGQKRAREADQAWDKFGASFKGLRNEIALMLSGPGTGLVNMFSGLIQNVRAAKKPMDDLNETMRETNRLARLNEQNPTVTVGPITRIGGGRTDLPPGWIDPDDVRDIVVETSRTAKLNQAAASQAAAAASAELASVQGQITTLRQMAMLHHYDIATQIEKLNALEEQTKSLETQRAVLQEIQRLYATTAGRQYLGSQMLGPSLPEGWTYQKDLKTSMAPGAGGEWRGPMGLRELSTGGGAGFTKVTDKAALSMDELTRGVLKTAVEAQKAAKQIPAAFQIIAGHVSSTVGDMVYSVISGTQQIAVSFRDLIASILADMAQVAVEKGAVTILKSIFGFPAQEGGTVRVGVRGVDTVPAVLGRNETVMDHSLTDAMRAFLRSQSSTPRGLQSDRSSSVNFGEGSFHFSGIGMDRRSLQKSVRDAILPEMAMAMKLAR